MASVVDHSFVMEDFIDDNLRVKLIVGLQSKMDYTDLTNCLIGHKKSQLLLTLIKEPELRTANKTRATLATFKESLR